MQPYKPLPSPIAKTSHYFHISVKSESLEDCIKFICYKLTRTPWYQITKVKYLIHRIPLDGSRVTLDVVAEKKNSHKNRNLAIVYIESHSSLESSNVADMWEVHMIAILVLLMIKYFKSRNRIQRHRNAFCSSFRLTYLLLDKSIALCIHIFTDLNSRAV